METRKQYTKEFKLDAISLVLVLTELKNRGLQDILIACVDGLTSGISSPYCAIHSVPALSH